MEALKLKRVTHSYVLADEVSITLLLVVECLEMLLNLESDDGWRLVGQVVGKLLGVHVGGG